MVAVFKYTVDSSNCGRKRSFQLTLNTTFITSGNDHEPSLRIFTCVTEPMNKAPGRLSIVSGVSCCSQDKQPGAVLPLVPRRHTGQPPFGILAVLQPGRATETFEHQLNK